MKKTYRNSLNTLMEVFDLGPTVALTILLVSGVILLTGIIFFVHSAPPTKLTISSGPEGSIFYGMAEKYKTALEKNGIKVNILTSNGSVENLQRISNPKMKVDLAIIQSGGEEDSDNVEDLASLGTLSYQPLFFFYRGTVTERISQMKGKTIAIGKEGSGARKLALKILKLNHMDEDSKLVDLYGDGVSKALLENTIDGAFIMGEDASVDVLRKLLNSNDIHLMSFKNSEAYARKIDILHMMNLPEGVIDFGLNIPKQTIKLVGPAVELIARKELHPALSDMILDTAMTIHGKAGIFKKRGEFPRPEENKIKLSDDATRFYKSGKSFLYRYLPFWLASLVNRALVVFLPMLLVLIPAVRSIPAIFRWVGQLRIRRRYRALLKLEERFKSEKDPEVLKDLLEQFERIEKDVQQMKVRAVFADQFYALRGHIDYVRRMARARMEHN
jgi:TRAP-type uncharacterized transport system substrate-binding protein